MLKADRVVTTQRARMPEFLIPMNRIRLSQLIRNPVVAAAFCAAEDDGLAPGQVEAGSLPVLSGGAAEAVPSACRRTLADVEG